ncbi:ABC transporter permease [Pelagibacterium flavum]|uniref:ABC transporter permease n=1 Tax=Pelagibacterium flavum TaxID=2984530 RepID=A0ABY6IR59_9HYPH|nr:ABC transporter permease [Pelagibacterium sp. YIM 151497]UYQ73099.1 ABC transporter permease [Pelagibacterium sp. YIM 151497]
MTNISANRRAGLTSREIVWFLLPALPFVLLALGWTLYWGIAKPNIGTLPPIWTVFTTLWQITASGELFAHIIASLGRLLAGVSVGIISGVLLGFVVGLNKRASDFFYPLVIFFSAISGIVWLPLVIGWLGLGASLFIFLIWNTVFFLVFQNTVLGVQLVPNVLELGVRTLGGSRLHTILNVTAYGALPYILSGIRSGIGFGWRALIAAELVGASSGLGQMIFRAAEFHRADIILAGCIVIGLLSLLMDRLLLVPLERRTIERWGLVSPSAKGA